MIYVLLKGHDFRYEINEIVRLFFSDYEIEYVNQIPAQSRDIFIVSQVIEKDGSTSICSQANINGKEHEVTIERYIPEDSQVKKKKILKRYVKLGVLKVLSDLSGKTIAWGILTGVRPTKVSQELITRRLDDDEIISVLESEYGVQKSKAVIMTQVARNEKAILESNNKNKISLYIGIPFCPDRCLYCSFTSNPVKKYSKTVESFIEALEKEIVSVERIIKRNSWEVETIYVGGGTPTSLEHEHLEELLKCIDRSYNMRSMKEITVEAGRPDTLDNKKLVVLKKHGVNRISINPQTMNEATLKLIGRNHSTADIVKAYKSARDEGFDNINMDIIVGLPGEDISMFAETIDKISEMGPESVTVHTLAVKKGSRLIEAKGDYNLPHEKEIETMIDMSRVKLAEAGMIPYYLYRQKNMVGHEENIGYSLPGKECIYNVKMIEEIQNIIALGPGAVSRKMDFETGGIEKIFNDKSVEGYIARIDEMIQRKEKAYLK